jgi:hypothetical protein
MKHTAWMLTVLFVVALPAGPVRGAEEAWRSGIGLSLLEDPKEAGREAAAAAREAFGEGEPKIVIVTAAIGQVTPDLVEGVAEHFPKGIIYGCEVAALIIPATNNPDEEELDILAGVSVLALGGDIDVVTESQNALIIEGDTIHLDNGRNIGAALLPAVEASTRPGRLIVTFGNQPNGPNQDFARGLRESLGETFPIVGGAAGRTGETARAKEIVRGEIVVGYNIAVFIAGRFRLGLAMEAGQHKPATADRTMANALAQGEGAEPMFAFVFNCRRRRAEMINERLLTEEHAVFLRHMSGVPFFGFYGPGEIGAPARGEPSVGAGWTVTTAVLFPLIIDNGQ